MTKAMLQSDIVSVEWLKENLTAENLIILDASIVPVGSLPTSTNKQYLPNTQVFDFENKVCDLKSSLPHTLPSTEVFTQEVRRLGVSGNSVVIIYDDKGLYAAPRAWWMFKVMGQKQVAVLDGGLPAWITAGEPLSDATANPKAEGSFTATLQKSQIVSADTVAAALEDPSCAVLDARSAGRFQGTEPEPRTGLRSGHMPNAVSLPFSNVLRNGHLKSNAELKTMFIAATGERTNLIFSCGSGVTAAILFLAATCAGYSNLALYDGSWSEWGKPSSRPVIGPEDQGMDHAT